MAVKSRTFLTCHCTWNKGVNYPHAGNGYAYQQGTLAMRLHQYKRLSEELVSVSKNSTFLAVRNWLSTESFLDTMLTLSKKVNANAVAT